MLISENVQKLSNGIVNCYLIFLKKKVILIDTGFAGYQRRIIAKLKKYGYNFSDLLTIYITHADADHYGSLHSLLIEENIRCFASDVEANAITKGISSRELKPKNELGRIFLTLIKPLFKVEPVKNIEVVDIGECHFDDEELIVIDSKGHTPGHLSYFLPAKRILFAGDSITIKHGVPLPSTGMNTWDNDLAEKSFKDQMALKPQIIAAGHGFLRFGD